MIMYEARFEWLYDLEAKVEETNPDQIIKVVHNIKPIKYLVLPGSDKIFPQQYDLDNESFSIIPTGLLKNPQDSFDLEDLANIDIDLTNVKPGESYPITLIQNMKSIRFGKFPIIISEILSGLKNDFLRNLQTVGIQAEPEKAYSRIAVYSINP
jgi:hypothetical protein